MSQPNYFLLSTFGSNGSGNEQLDSPNKCFVTNDYIYIADTGNNRLMQWFLNGTFRNKVTLSSIIDVIVFKHLIIGAKTDGIYIYDQSLNLLGSISISNISGIDTDDHNIYIITSTGTLYKYGRRSNLIGSISMQGSSDTYGKLFVSRNHNTIFVMNTTDKTIEVYKKDDLKYVSTIDLSLSSLQHMGSDGYYLYVLNQTGTNVKVINDGSYTEIDNNTFVNKVYSSIFIKFPWLFLVNTLSSAIDVVNGYDFTRSFIPSDEYGVVGMKPMIVNDRAVIADDTTDDSSFIEGQRAQQNYIMWRN